MTKTIEITKIVAVDDTIKYEIHDHTCLLYTSDAADE